MSTGVWKTEGKATKASMSGCQKLVELEGNRDGLVHIKKNLRICKIILIFY